MNLDTTAERRAQARRLGQIVRMLSSDKPGEVAAAAAGLHRTLTASGLDIHDLAETVVHGLTVPTSTQPRTSNSQTYNSTTTTTTTTTARRPDGRPLKFGEHLVCDQETGVFRACPCGSTDFTVAEGVGPHFAQLICKHCQRRGRWLPRSHFPATT